MPDLRAIFTAIINGETDPMRLADMATGPGDAGATRGGPAVRLSPAPREPSTRSPQGQGQTDHRHRHRHRRQDQVRHSRENLHADQRRCGPIPIPCSHSQDLGNGQLGCTLKATGSTWGPKPVTLKYQWHANNSPIPATSSRTSSAPERRANGSPSPSPGTPPTPRPPPPPEVLRLDH